MGYLYETHLHTQQASACASSRGQEYIAQYQDAGYAGIIVTDHFYNGNSSISRAMKWHDWVSLFCRGYEDAYNEGLRRGFDVFFGWEETFDGDDYLIYGLDKTWLLEHPEVRNWSRLDQYLEVERSGGAVVQAHPFRQRYYISQIHLAPALVNAVEVANGSNDEPAYDALALRYAQKLSLPVTAGSDIHNTDQMKTDAVFGVYLTKKMQNIGDYVTALTTGTITGIKTSQGRCDYHGNEMILSPVCIHNAQDEITGDDIWDFLN